MLDYPLPRIRCLLAAVARQRNREAADLLDLITLGSRGSAEDLQTIKDQLTGSDDDDEA